MKKKALCSILALVLLFAISFQLAGCNRIKAENMMEGISGGNVMGRNADDPFVSCQMHLAVMLFQSSVAAGKNSNILISPLSIQLALAMTANGANGQTREEMEALLGGGISLEDLNEYLHTYVNSLPSEEKYKLHIANSIWFRDDENRLHVEQNFLQRNADYYRAQIYKAAFDAQTLRDINTWVDQNTDGMIDKILDDIDCYDVMYLINAIAFDAQWQTGYQSSDVRTREFTNIAGKKTSALMMHSEENLYLKDNYATGFIKPYQDGKYSFAALLPNEGVDIYDYIAGLTGEGLANTIGNAQSVDVAVSLPKFSYEYEMTMNSILMQLGMPTAFDSASADFSRLGYSTAGNIYIGNVKHKTFICVDEAGTKAGAVTNVAMKDLCAVYRTVTLDRPFVYMIIDNQTNLPIFMGVVADIPQT